jgi:Skp family chaperone for outer membrane proteins
MRAVFAAASVVAVVVAGFAFAQQVSPVAQSAFQSQVLTINQQRLFEESQFGKESLTRLEADSRALQAEIRKVETDLEIEERLLTERRATLPPAQFQPLASEFDDKVEKIRGSWGEKDRDLKRQREEDQQKFIQLAVPILAQLMQDMGAVMLIDQSAVMLSLDRVDITQIAIARINEQLSQTAAPASGGATQVVPANPAPDAAAPKP